MCWVPMLMACAITMPRDSTTCSQWWPPQGSEDSQMPQAQGSEDAQMPQGSEDAQVHMVLGSTTVLANSCTQSPPVPRLVDCSAGGQILCPSSPSSPIHVGTQLRRTIPMHGQATSRAKIFPWGQHNQGSN